ncbi:hypothetical protein LRP49_19220 [Enterovibrio sp. ZSDZ35]|uniref:Secreted protein n=1 Tax=Enterovibrio qingdaonensis TaxID=2899818 RepID=A0ABT5QQZ4_9GAMM|nr:hypothetical protein [Enterovibrio sp. ZSDZ35]MDD1783304.1 hypothetical protein [Enterovibrio sp. ZSDZ35]
MKKYVSSAALVCLLSLIGFSAHASNGNGNATQSGPLVICTYADGSSNYVPSVICSHNGGTFVRNWGNQW